MTHILKAFGIHRSISFETFIAPAIRAMAGMPQLESRGYRPLQMSFEDHLKILVFFHLEEHTSARHLIQVLQEDEFARNEIAPEKGIKKSSFSEATNTRGFEQFMQGAFQKCRSNNVRDISRKNLFFQCIPSASFVIGSKEKHRLGGSLQPIDRGIFETKIHNSADCTFKCMLLDQYGGQIFMKTIYGKNVLKQP